MVTSKTQTIRYVNLAKIIVYFALQKPTVRIAKQAIIFIMGIVFKSVLPCTTVRISQENVSHALAIASYVFHKITAIHVK